ncbi:MAG: ABC transporter ATP-binding protein [Methanocorpusculum sp.]|nr:ABC transporter ATP-binding protein [Methanocorpusculum sp.]
MTENIIEAVNISKTYGKKTVIKPLNLSVRKGEILAVIGPSGAGKSTLIRMLDGIEPMSSGDLFIFGQKLCKSSRYSLRGRMGVLFQKTVLFDRSVEENISLGLSYRHLPSAEIKSRTKDILERMGMSEYAKRSAKTLSGGEGQRVAFARVLVTRPEILFLDEPTANLDPIATAVLEEMILKENRENKTTIIINTHDQAQGQRLADRIAVMIDGEFKQIDSAEDVIYHPKTEDAARFVGFQNIFSLFVVNNSVNIGGYEIPLPSEFTCAEKVLMMIRAEDIILSKESGKLRGTVVSSVRRGAFIEAGVEVNGVMFRVSVKFRDAGNEFNAGDAVYLNWKDDAVHFIPSC